MKYSIPRAAAFTGLCLAGPAKRVDDGPVWDTVPAGPAPSNAQGDDLRVEDPPVQDTVPDWILDIFPPPIDPKNMVTPRLL